MRFAALGVEERNSSEKTRDAVNAFRVRKFRDTPHRGGVASVARGGYTNNQACPGCSAPPSENQTCRGRFAEEDSAPGNLRSVAGCNGDQDICLSGRAVLFLGRLEEVKMINEIGSVRCASCRRCGVLRDALGVGYSYTHGLILPWPNAAQEAERSFRMPAAGEETRKKKLKR